MIQLFGIKNCDTVKKAQAFLKQHQVAFTFVDFRDHAIDAKTLQSFVDVVGWEQLINKRSTTYRNLSDAEKRDISIQLVLKKPTLIKRPVLRQGKQISVGFSEKLYAELITNT